MITPAAFEAPPLDAATLRALPTQIRTWAQALGFADIRISDTDLRAEEADLMAWLAAGMHGEMDYMAKHGNPPGTLRARPAELVPGTLRILTARMDYLPATLGADWRERETARLTHPQEAVISLYARGRDYHKVLRQRLQQLADQIGAVIGPFGYRVFTDSAPLLEVALAKKAGLGWRGKHSLLLHREAGSMFFLGEILLALPLAVDAPQDNHCGACTACIDSCPTGAIVAPYRVDARRCISYLTIEYDGDIPEALRPLMGNRIYGCDDCQIVCPWNKFAQTSPLPDFAVRHGLDQVDLLTLFAWDAATFSERMAGSPIRRIGYTRWQRNLAVALGNALTHPHTQTSQATAILQALTQAQRTASPLVQRHIDWALRQAGAQENPK